MQSDHERKRPSKWLLMLLAAAFVAAVAGLLWSYSLAGRLTHAPRWHAVRANYGQYRFTLPAAAVGIFTVPNK